MEAAKSSEGQLTAADIISLIGWERIPLKYHLVSLTDHMYGAFVTGKETLLTAEICRKKHILNQ